MYCRSLSSKRSGLTAQPEEGIQQAVATNPLEGTSMSTGSTITSTLSVVAPILEEFGISAIEQGIAISVKVYATLHPELTNGELVDWGVGQVKHGLRQKIQFGVDILWGIPEVVNAVTEAVTAAVDQVRPVVAAPVVPAPASTTGENDVAS